MKAIATDGARADVDLLVARVAMAGPAIFVLLVASLHVVKPELDPSWRFISEYAIGPHGWLMTVAFGALAAGHVALATTLWSRLPRVGGRVGLAMLLVSAAGLVIAAVFPTDPITTSPDAATEAGELHQVGGTLGMAMPLAVVLVGWALARNPAWAAARRAVAAASIVAVISSIASMAVLGVFLSRSGGRFGPDVLVGWPHRLEIVAHCGWLVVIARAALAQRRGR